MAIDERDGAAMEPAGQHGERLPDASEAGLPGTGLLKGLAVTLKTMMKPAITQQYPHVKPDLPARTRGVIALKQENCTVCYKCSRACPDWCIYIDAHKETHEPASGGKGRSVKVLDRFAIDFALCMYCGICVEVCPFDALFWSPEFEYAEYDILKLTHEMDRLEEWTYKVLPPPPLEVGAVQPPPPTPAAVPAVAAAAAPPPQAVGAATEAPAAAQEASAAAPAKPPRAPRVEVEPDQETFDRVLAAELEKGTDRRVAEGRAKSAAMRAARAKAGGS
jgi:formate hydrogenlyase subunit 6/NADH:ubiquinone oxidoreductase subunit I